MSKKAFTIIELLTVIAVLIILIGIAIPRIRGMSDQGNIARAKGELQTLQTAVESYYTYKSPRVYPPTTTTIGGSFLVTSTPAILSSTPPYDPWGSSATTEYTYTLSANSKYYVIGSNGPNLAQGALAISATGVVSGKDIDDICVTNGSGC